MAAAAQDTAVFIREALGRNRHMAAGAVRMVGFGNGTRRMTAQAGVILYLQELIMLEHVGAVAVVMTRRAADGPRLARLDSRMTGTAGGDLRFLLDHRMTF